MTELKRILKECGRDYHKTMGDGSINDADLITTLLCKILEELRK